MSKKRTFSEFDRRNYVEPGMQATNCEQSWFYLTHSGRVIPVSFEKSDREIPVRNCEFFTYTSAALARLKNAEIALRAFAQVRKIRTELVTLTFPMEMGNAERWKLNDKFRDSIRKKYVAGLWCVEAHTGRTYKNRKGVEVSYPAMRGLVHFHYRIVTNDRGTLLDWVRSRQEWDGVKNNSYDVSDYDGDDELYICDRIHEGKKEQKKLIAHHGRIWATWGLNKKSVIISTDDFNELNMYTQTRIKDKDDNAKFNETSLRSDVAAKFIQVKILKHGTKGF